MKQQVHFDSNDLKVQCCNFDNKFDAQMIGAHRDGCFLYVY